MDNLGSCCKGDSTEGPDVNRARTMKEVKEALGEKGICEMEELRDFICGRFNVLPASLRDPSNFRYAQSIICRGEAEIFNVATPRYALRAYITQEPVSFVNARRLGVLCDQATSWARTTFPHGGHIEKARRKWLKNCPGWVLNKHTCVADSVLCIPGMNRYHILTVELGEVNGEGEEIIGTPYIRHIPLAGGMCAQAVCFIATSLLHSYARGVHSIPDITALATGTKDLAHAVELRGLDHCELVEYFNHKEVNLKAICQVTQCWGQNMAESGTLRVFPPKAQCETFARIARSYLLSDMPVIVNLDLGREAGLPSKFSPMISNVSIFARNGLSRKQHLPDPYEIRQRNHAVCLVGCGIADDNLHDFYFNDPTLFPFMIASAEQMFDASCYASESNLCERYAPLLLPVTPAAVRLPLGDWRITSASEKNQSTLAHPGLIKLAQYHQSDRTVRLPLFACPYDPGEFRLVKIGEIPNHDFVKGITGDNLVANKVTRWCENASRHDRLGPDHWCWIQYSPNATWQGNNCSSIWIWDAEIPAPRISEFEDAVHREYLLVVFEWTKDQCEVLGPKNSIQEAPKQEEQAKTESTPKCRVRLNRSIISSFSVDGIRSSLACWPEGIRFCDLYAFMSPDEKKLTCWQIRKYWMARFLKYTCPAQINSWLRHFPLRTFVSGKLLRVRIGSKKTLGVPWPIVDSRERMEALTSNKRAISNFAERIDNVFAANEARVLAIDSFVPGLASDGETGKTAQRALEFLIALAQEFQARGHPCRTVEIVAGSLFEGTWEGIQAGPRISSNKRVVYLANVQSRSSALDSLCRRLCELNECCSNRGDYPVQLAVELEPGPFFVINRWPVLKQFCEKMDGQATFSHIGLNMDIAHWSMAGITPEMVFDCEVVRKRIIHGHISDHGNGHFADVALSRVHKDLGHFQAWVYLLGSAAHEPRQPGYPQYWGGLALELEACKDQGLVVESINVLNKLVHDSEELTEYGRKSETPPLRIEAVDSEKAKSGHRRDRDKIQDLDIQE